MILHNITHNTEKSLGSNVYRNCLDNCFFNICKEKYNDIFVNELINFIQRNSCHIVTNFFSLVIYQIRILL